jgi:hypothetical protein
VFSDLMGMECGDVFGNLNFLQNNKKKEKWWK